jgi:hypothetical protein
VHNLGTPGCERGQSFEQLGRVGTGQLHVAMAALSQLCQEPAVDQHVEVFADGRPKNTCQLGQLGCCPGSAVEKRPILYFGTPVELLSTENDDGSFNLAPMQSAWALGDVLVLPRSSRPSSRRPG